MDERLSADRIDAELRSLTGWRREGGAITRTWQTPSFSHAVLFLVAVGQVAEAAGHHPDLTLHGYDKLTVRLTTHSADGVTQRDLALARQIEAIPLRNRP